MAKRPLATQKTVTLKALQQAVVQRAAAAQATVAMITATPEAGLEEQLDGQQQQETFRSAGQSNSGRSLDADEDGLCAHETVQGSPTVRHALQIPEILGKILSYALNQHELLPQMTHTSSLFSSRLPSSPLWVCRAWYAIGKRVQVKRYACEITATVPMDRTHIRKHLVRQQSLQITFRHGTSSHYDDGSSTRHQFNQLLQWFKERRRPIRELRLVGLSDIVGEKEIISLLSETSGRATWLTSLELVFSSTMHTIDLTALLTMRDEAFQGTLKEEEEEEEEGEQEQKQNSNNDTLALCSNTSRWQQRLIRLPSLCHLQLCHVAIAKIPFGWCLPTATKPRPGYRNPHSKALQLRTLSLISIAIRPQCLETLLTQLCGPAMERLQVTNLMSFPLPRHPTTQPSPSPPRRLQSSAKTVSSNLFRRLGDQCHRLAWVQIAREAPNDNAVIDILVKMHTAFPRAGWKGVSFIVPTEGLWRMHIDRHLTALEIQAPFDRNYGHASPVHLHAFLCSDQARSLQKLIAPAISYSVELMVPELIRTFAAAAEATTTATAAAETDAQRNNSSSNNTPARSYWQCRDLRVLDLSFSSDRAQSHLVTLPARTRGMFGYIVAHCPRLEELSLRCKTMDTSGNNGLCFLSRLYHLRKVVLWSSRFMFAIDGFNPAPTSFGNRISTADQRGMGNSGGGGGGNGGGSSTFGSSLKDVRWVVGRPTLADLEKKWTSLEHCRRLAMLDVDGCFFEPGQAGEGVLWPAAQHQVTDAIQPCLSTSSEHAKDKPLMEDGLLMGCCWQQMETFTIRITDSSFCPKHVFLANVRQMGRLRPDVQFEGVFQMF